MKTPLEKLGDAALVVFLGFLMICVMACAGIGVVALYLLMHRYFFPLQ